MRAVILNQTERQIGLGVPILFLGGILCHELYRLSGQFFLLGLFVPVNGSVGEQFKLLLWPMVLWWTVCFLLMTHGKGRCPIDAPAWFSAALAALISAESTMALLYYFYTGALGIASPAADIALLFLGAAVGQAVSFRVYRRGSAVSWVLPVILLVAILACSVTFTIAPPQLPLFLDPQSGTRGIFRI